MHIRGRGPIDLAFFLSGSLNSELRRRHEYDLLGRYADQLKANGVQNYDLAQCVTTTVSP
jgi:hypothetical protein